MPQRSRITSWPFLLLAVALLSCLFLGGGQAATPEKPFADLQEGDSLTAAWLMGTFNTIYNWSQTASSTLNAHATNHTNHVAATAAHGATGAVVGTTNTQSLTNKTLDSTNSVVGEAVKSGTVADARIASTICRDSELTTHAGTTATHGVSGAIVGTSDTQTLTNKTLGTTNSVDGGAVKTGTVADARIDAAICRDSELTTHGNLTATHGATGAVMGTTNTQTVTNKTMGTGCTWGGTAIPVANGGTGATTAAAALTNLGLSATAAELNYVDGVTSAIQTQINGKAASSHTHGNITNAGAIGSTASLPIITTTSGVLTTGSFGTTAGTFCQGNDSRLSDARTPTAHTHNYAGSASAGGAATSALTANGIRTSAPASPADGDIWVE